MSKYVSKEGDIVSCPDCRGVVLRDLKKDRNLRSMSFKIRCPHCNKDVAVKACEGEGVEVKKPEGQP